MPTPDSRRVATASRLPTATRGSNNSYTTSWDTTARTDAAKIQIENLINNFELYKLEVGTYPSEQDGIEALLEAPNDAERWNGPYVRKRDNILDPWGQLYGYRFPGDYGDFDLYSLGADGIEGGEGEDADITSW